MAICPVGHHAKSMRALSDYRSSLCLLVSTFLVVSSASAEDLFQFDVRTTSGTAIHDVVGGSSLLDLGNSLIKAQDQFAQFDNRDLAASLNYAGVPNAVRATVNASGTQAVLDIPSTGLHKVFTAANRDELQNQVED